MRIGATLTGHLDNGSKFFDSVKVSESTQAELLKSLNILFLAYTRPMHSDDNLDYVTFVRWRQISKSLFTLIFPKMSSQLIKNAKDPEDLDELLDFSNKSYRDNKSKKSGLEINFPLL